MEASRARDAAATVRRAAVAAGWAQAAALREAAAAGERAYPGTWCERERAAIDACRALGAFLAHHPTNPVARAIAGALAEAARHGRFG